MSQFFGHVVLSVRRFDECFDFYTKALQMEAMLTHRGEGHPDWALLRLGEMRLALHAEYDGMPLHGGMPVCLNFFVNDIPATLARIPEFGGTVTAAPQEYDFRPTQPVMALFGRFKDPDGHEHYLVKETERLKGP
jgi:predicted enzyme related to lactoylglutathione lyase